VREVCNYLVVSDLHLSEGRDPATGKTSRLEDFLHDDAFARFLRYHEEIRGQPRFGGRPWLLILNGDIFDFLQVVSLPADGLPLRTVKGVDHHSELSANEREYGLGTTARECEWKLKRIAEGHQGFFAALGRFVAHGNRIAVIRGNHDVELYWERVQESFVMETQQAYEREIRAEDGGPPLTPGACRDRIRFYAWFYYEPGRLYVEHGGQYEGANHFRDILHPTLPRDPEHIELPWGSLFVRYLFNKVEHVHPFADNIKPMTRYMSWALRKDTLRTVELLLTQGWVFLRAVWKAGRKEAASALHAPAEKATAEGTTLPLPSHVADEIAALAEARDSTTWQMAMGSLLQGLISLLTLGAVGVLIALAGVTLVTTSRPWWMAVVYAVAAVLAWLAGRRLRRIVAGLWAQDYLREAAQELERLLAPEHRVPLIAMGHNHKPTVERLGEAWYVNTGAWVPLYQQDLEAHAAGPIAGSERLTFLRLGWEQDLEAHAAGTPELLRWHDAGIAPSKMVLWEDDGLTHL